MLSGTTSLLPRIPAPPHDPKWWLLNGKVGWRPASPASQGLQNVQIAADTGVLTLQFMPGAARSTVENSGSFGGVVPPANVALGPDCSIYLFDTTAGQLKRFDACCCAFLPVPCFGGIGAGPRQLNNPHGIAIRGGNLYVCDTGNNRVVVLSLHGFVLRDFWTLPPAAQLAQTWQPYAIAFDRKGRAYITDPANGCIHRFALSGIWEKSFFGFGVVTFIASDCQSHIFVVVQGESQARIIDTEGNSLGTVSDPAGLTSSFPSLPFSVDTSGNLNLRALCVNGTGTGIFDSTGAQLPVAPPVPPVTYFKQGTFITAGLDSKFYRCQWHRIILRGRVPEGASIQVSTFTSETQRSLDEIAPDEWVTNQTVVALQGKQWDCIVMSGPGRYLWLQLRFNSNGAATPCLEWVKIEFPRISLRRYLPAAFGEDPNGAQFTDRFLSIFDTTLRSVEHEIDYEARYFDPLSAPATKPTGAAVDFLTWLASWVGISLDRQLPEQTRRALLKKGPSLFSIRGTPPGLWQQLLLLLGLQSESCRCPHDQPKRLCRCIPLNCSPVEKRPCAWQPPPLILEHFHLRRWLFVGTGRLSDDAVLWGKRIVNRSQLNANAQVSVSQLILTQDPYRDPFYEYAHKFSVFVPAACGKSIPQKRALINLLNSEKPAHTQYQLEFVEPRFRIGFQSMIGLDSVVGRYPEGVTLNQSELGSGTVLGSAPNALSGPSFAVGKQARIGSTTRLD
jgi:phage tail-like protein